MTDAPDAELLERFARDNSETAFAALVERHLGLVHSVALRHTANPQHAQDITQAVFIILARKAAALNRKTVLPGWLYHTARLTAANFQRAETRRIRREQEAYMQSTLNEAETANAWTQMSPLLDEAMSHLRAGDRDALVLRYFQNKSLPEVGAAMGLAERAAQKRVLRAIEKLRKFFAKRGVELSSASLTGAVSVNSIQTAPVTLVKTISTVAIAKGAAASSSTLTLVKGALKIMAWTKAKTAIVVSTAILLVAGTATTLVIQHRPKPLPAPSAQTEFSRASWTNAGYAEPQSAVLSTLWAIREGDGQKINDSFTPALQQKFQQMFAKQMQAEGKSFIEVLSQEAAKHFSQNTGIKILDQKTAAGGQIALRVYVPGEKSEHTFLLKKIGNEWKVNDIQ